MAIVYSDWIGESTPTSGTGDIVLGGSLQGFAPMAAAGIGEIYYTIVDGQNKETGLGHYDGTSGFARTSIIATLVDGVHTPSGAPLDLSGSAQIYGTVNSGTMKNIIDRLNAGDQDIDEVYVYIDEQISEVNQAITDLSNQINQKVDELGPDDVGAYPRTGGDVTGPALFKNSVTGIHIEGGSDPAGTGGDFRYNPTLGVFEGYFNGKWRNVGGGTGVTWAPITASVNPAEVGKGYLINAAGLTITLPAAPEAGNSIGIGDYNGQNFTATVARNGKPIMGIAQDFTFNVKNANVVFSFVDNTIGWVLTQGFGESSVPMAIMNKSAPAVTVGQTVFSFPNYGTDSVDVYYNGKKLLRSSDYTADNVANTVTLTVGVSLADDVVELYNWNQAAVIQADKISYDNITSKIPSATMQGAIDNLAQVANANKIMNGGMQISQRGNSGSTTLGAATFTADRWTITPGGVALTWNTFTPSPTTVLSLRLNGIAGNTGNNIRQRIESFNCVDLYGKKVTLSFKVFGVTSGITITPVLYYADAADNYAAFTLIQTGHAFNVPSNSTWASHSFTFDALPAGVLNGLMLSLNTTAIVAGAQVNIAEVKLEIGERATPFVYPDMSEELAKCQRYYEIGNEPFMYMFGITGVTSAYGDVKFVVSKRITPTVTMSGWQYYSAGIPTAFVPSINSTKVDAFRFTGSSFTTWQGWPGTGTWTASAEIL